MQTSDNRLERSWLRRCKTELGDNLYFMLYKLDKQTGSILTREDKCMVDGKKGLITFSNFYCHLFSFAVSPLTPCERIMNLFNGYEGFTGVQSQTFTSMNWPFIAKGYCKVLSVTVWNYIQYTLTSSWRFLWAWEFTTDLLTELTSRDNQVNTSQILYGNCKYRPGCHI